MRKAVTRVDIQQIQDGLEGTTLVIDHGGEGGEAVIFQVVVIPHLPVEDKYGLISFV